MRDEAVEVGHPLFRAMVLMGSSLAVGCGGNTTETGGRRHIDDPGGTGASPNGGSAARSPEDAGVTSGPVIIMPDGTGASPTSEAGGAGGRMSGTGGVTVGTGGAVAAPPACPPSQLDCPGASFNCDYSTQTWTSEVMCKCNPGRPSTAADCPPGKTFTCLTGASENAGPVPFSCKCMPYATDCTTACVNAYSPDADVEYDCAPGPENQFLCGCAVALLR